MSALWGTVDCFSHGQLSTGLRDLTLGHMANRWNWHFPQAARCLKLDMTDSRSLPSDDIGRKRETPMNSTPTPKETEPHEGLVARTDERLAHVHEQLARADEQLARVTEQLT